MPGHGQPSARALRRHPRPVPRSPRPDATRGGRVRCPDQSLQPRLGAPTACLERAQTGRSPNAPADVGIAPGCRSRPTHPRRRVRRRRCQCQAGRPLAILVSGHPSARLPRSAAVVWSSQATRPCGAESFLRCDRKALAHWASRTRRPARILRDREEAPRAQAGCPGSQRRTDREPAHPAAPSTPHLAVPVHRCHAVR